MYLWRLEIMRRSVGVAAQCAVGVFLIMHWCVHVHRLQLRLTGL
jgi:hypothetical protein